MCVQNLDDSRGLAIRITYRISLRSSSLWEPRHPLLKVVCSFRLFLGGQAADPKLVHTTSTCSAYQQCVGRSQATLVSFRYCGQFRLGGKNWSTRSDTPLFKKVG